MRFLRMRELQVKTGLGPSSIYEAIKEGEFPPPIKLSDRRSGWLESEVEDWMQRRVEERDGGARLSATHRRGDHARQV
jgi:prophage regulatory protein